MNNEPTAADVETLRAIYDRQLRKSNVDCSANEKAEADAWEAYDAAVNARRESNG